LAADEHHPPLHHGNAFVLPDQPAGNMVPATLLIPLPKTQKQVQNSSRELFQGSRYTKQRGRGSLSACRDAQKQEMHFAPPAYITRL
jgi:hypothetical protein